MLVRQSSTEDVLAFASGCRSCPASGPYRLRRKTRGQAQNRRWRVRGFRPCVGRRVELCTAPCCFSSRGAPRRAATGRYAVWRRTVSIMRVGWS
jgi:hypothetical protein